MRLFVSFDYELAWGTYEILEADYLRSNVLHANSAAMRLLEVNESRGIPAAWGLVGAAVDRRPLGERLGTCARLGAPIARLQAQLDQLDRELWDNVTTIPIEFLSALQESRCQVASSHTYSHLYALRASKEELADDLRTAQRAFVEAGLAQPMFLIAPKNLVTPSLSDAAKAVGIASVRVNPNTWLYRTPASAVGSSRSRLLRYLRIADAFMPLSERLRERESDGDPELRQVEGNFFLRPNLAEVAFRAHSHRLRRWVRHCAHVGKDVHVWTHPHNFGADVAASVDNYERALDVLEETSARLCVSWEWGRLDAMP